MKINATKTAAQNLLDLLSVAAGRTLTDQMVTVGTPTAYSDPNGVYNTQVTITAIKNKGFRGSVTIKYKRLVFDQVYPSMTTTWAVLPTDTVASVTAAIMQQMSALNTEFMLNSNTVITLPDVNNQNVDLPIAVRSASKVCMPATTRNLKLVYSPPVVNVTYSASGNNLNTLALLGNPAGVAHYKLTLTGTIGSASSTTPALTIGVLPAGSMITIINQGTIQGAGGAGGAYNTAGATGGTAISALMNATIDNTTGKIFGGGGGGGGCNQSWPGVANLLLAGYIRAAGGGGAGTVVGVIGTGTAVQTVGTVISQPVAGTATTGGAGAVARNTGNTTQYSQGGKGGDPGTAGTAGVATYGTAGSTTLDNRAGGAAGKAIELNGKSVTFSAGNNATQIKGPVS